MSVVTNILLNVGPLDRAAFEGLQVALRAAGIGELGDLTENFADPPERERRWGGNKFPEVLLYGGAYNHLDLRSFLELARAAEWQYPDDVQCFIMEQQEFWFRVLELVAADWVELVRPNAPGEG